MTMAQESLRELENKYEILVEDHGLVQGVNNRLRHESAESKAALKTLVRASFALQATVFQNPD